MKNTCLKKSITLSIYTLPVFIMAGIFLFGFFLTSIGAFPSYEGAQVLSNKSTDNINEEKIKVNSEIVVDETNDTIKTDGTVGGANTSRTPGMAVDDSWETSWMK